MMQHATFVALAVVGAFVVAWLFVGCATVAVAVMLDRRRVHRQACIDREFRRLIAQLTDTIPYDQETD